MKIWSSIVQRMVNVFHYSKAEACLTDRVSGDEYLEALEAAGQDDVREAMRKILEIRSIGG